MILYEKRYRLFSMGYRDVSYISYKFIQLFVRKDQLYEMYENPLGVSYIQIIRTKEEKKKGRGNGQEDPHVSDGCKEEGSG